MLFIRSIACSLALAVLCGAFGAHALKNHVNISLLTTWNTGVHYHFMQSLGLLILALWTRFEPSYWLKRITLPLISVGMVLFSGSLYLLVLLQIRWIGIVTPIGGLSMIIGWLSLAFIPRPH